MKQRYITIIPVVHRRYGKKPEIVDFPAGTNVMITLYPDESFEAIYPRGFRDIGHTKAELDGMYRPFTSIN